ncbi:MAG: selenocysteine-specific translation elongation factor [Gammaproteobacteria bacterium]|nr:selenocysteine-specific translation elongation factor [Gammaproteobacteria bacterium]
MIVTLAGHVDHGKTAVVRALTGVDTDRLAEERRRGLTIDLGFAYADIGGARIGFVDVPGHRRFIHNMVAGVARNQYALLVVAADDGVMPQTVEHLQILKLLGLRQGIVALNKIDRSEPDRVSAVRRDIQGLTSDSFLRHAEVVEVSCTDGRGIDTLRAHLQQAGEAYATTVEDRAFRLAVDRVFALRGVGVVATGTVVSGATRTDDRLAIAATGQLLRVRGLFVQDTPAERAVEGDRVALNVTGARLDDLARGDWIVAESTAGTFGHTTVELEVLGDFPRAVRHWAPVHIYAATSHSQGRISLLDASPIEPGANAAADIILNEPAHMKVGDRLILRDQDLDRTLGGGTVIDVETPHGRRRAPDRLDRIAALRGASTDDALTALAHRDAVEADTFRNNWNLTANAMRELVQRSGLIEHRDHIVHPELANATERAVVDALAKHHETERESGGMPLESLANELGASTTITRIAIESLTESGEVRAQSGSYALAEHSAEIPQALATLFDRIEPLLDSEQPPSLGDVAKQLRTPLPALERDMRALAAIGLCQRVSPNRYFLNARLRAMADVALGLQENFTVRQFRDASGMGRNVVIEVLEHFDRKGFTYREGDARSVVGDPGQVLD